MFDRIYGLVLVALCIGNAISFWKSPEWWTLGSAIFFGITSIIVVLRGEIDSLKRGG